MAFAGIWASRLDPDTEIWNRTCSIITTGAEGPVYAPRPDAGFPRPLGMERVARP